MPEHRAEIVKRVMRSLEDTTDPDQLLTAYFDAEHDIVVGAARETLEATDEFVSDAGSGWRASSDALRAPWGRGRRFDARGGHFCSPLPLLGAPPPWSPVDKRSGASANE